MPEESCPVRLWAPRTTSVQSDTAGETITPNLHRDVKILRNTVRCTTINSYGIRHSEPRLPRKTTLELEGVNTEALKSLESQCHRHLPSMYWSHCIAVVYHTVS